MRNIPYLQKLDLEGVNRTITEINNAISLLDNPTTISTPNDASKIIWNEEVGVSTTEISKTGISLKKDELYYFQAHFFLGAACNVSLYINRDEVDANYHRLDGGTVHGAAFSATQSSDAQICSTASTNDKISMYGTITFSHGIFNLIFLGYRINDEFLYMRNMRYAGAVELDDVFELRLKASIVGGLSKNSHVTIWRVL